MVAILAIYQSSIDAAAATTTTTTEEDPKQDKFLSESREFQWALEAIDQSSQPDVPTAWMAITGIINNLNEAKSRNGGTLNEENQKMKDKYEKILDTCQETKMNCPDQFQALMSLSKINPNLINFFNQCAFEQSERCPNEYTTWNPNQEERKLVTNGESSVDNAEDAEEERLRDIRPSWPEWHF